MKSKIKEQIFFCENFKKGNVQHLVASNQTDITIIRKKKHLLTTFKWQCTSTVLYW